MCVCLNHMTGWRCFLVPAVTDGDVERAMHSRRMCAQSVKHSRVFAALIFNCFSQFFFFFAIVLLCTLLQIPEAVREICDDLLCTCARCLQTAQSCGSASLQWGGRSSLQ